MNAENIKYNNELIAKFMGSKSTLEDHTDYNEDGTIKYTPNKDGSKWYFTTWSKPDSIPNDIGWGIYMLGDFKYNSSWDWLMPVVEKIESIGCDIIICNKYSELNYNNNEYKTISLNINNKIMSIYNIIIDFIKWYNINNG